MSLMRILAIAQRSSAEVGAPEACQVELLKFWPEAGAEVILTTGLREVQGVLNILRCRENGRVACAG